MVYSVVTGLTWLHKNSYVHRDIWLANILFLPGVRDYRYILTDFEYGNASGLKVSERLKDWDDSTLTKNNKYTMLMNLNLVNSEIGMKFLDGLRNKRISTKNVLDHEWFRQTTF
ncbi:hypothetical protein RirG_205650 [Rhizophagus irregularis DAOM 197198w]|uniref:Protein kinase domain-containing protein n=1 Tax=Rhizophagus irregularis (strain DAOM 197198w) TaxID=1432141 RepID=A0A015JRD1_RHIIW|nr:hypothetical protein RirG_205650 [Rhizophagus irregularis DAOM 197198w]